MDLVHASSCVQQTCVELDAHERSPVWTWLCYHLPQHKSFNITHAFIVWIISTCSSLLQFHDLNYHARAPQDAAHASPGMETSKKKNDCTTYTQLSPLGLTRDDTHAGFNLVIWQAAQVQPACTSKA